ncbi:MAG: response regulator, partial [Spirochaetia bacterium]|nr:response regulator [Spirochaetia bacterium]
MENNHILIVEDSLTQAMRLRYILEKEDLMVDVATNGREALDILRNIPINIVISDVMMPEMNGYELCKAMRADPKLSSIPVMLVTTLSDPTDVIRALEAGADNFLIKPYDESTLISRIKYIIANMEIRKTQGAEIGLEVYFNGRKYFLNSSRIQMID